MGLGVQLFMLGGGFVLCTLLLSAGVVIDVYIVVCANVLNLTVIVQQCVPETRHLQKFQLTGGLSLSTEHEDLTETNHILM